MGRKREAQLEARIDVLERQVRKLFALSLKGKTLQIPSQQLSFAVEKTSHGPLNQPKTT